MSVSKYVFSVFSVKASLEIIWSGQIKGLWPQAGPGTPSDH